MKIYRVALFVFLFSFLTMALESCWMLRGKNHCITCPPDKWGGSKEKKGTHHN